MDACVSDSFKKLLGIVSAGARGQVYIPMMRLFELSVHRMGRNVCCVMPLFLGISSGIY